MQPGEGTSEGRRLPSPAMVLAVAALIAALAGTAVAVDKITSKDIAKNAVRSKHIKRGQVKAKDTDLTMSRFGSTFHADNTVSLDELNLSVKVERGDVVSVSGFALARDADGPGLDVCRLGLFVTAPGVEDQGNVLGFDSDSFERRSIDGTVNGTTADTGATGIDFLIPVDGTFRVEPAFFGTPLTDCEIRTRGLAVTVKR